MKVIVKPHSIQVISTPVNELEVNVTTVEFEFSEEITEEYVKEAYFTLDDNTYKKVIFNNECEIPSEVLTKVGTVELGVVAYYVDPVNNELIRYNPKPGYFTSWEGSLKDAENSQPITPSEMEQYEQALQDGLSEVNDKLGDIDTALTQVDNLDIDASKVGTISTVTITNKAGTTKSVQILDGINGTNGKDGVDGKDGKDGTNGTNGVDGISPTATITKSGSTATITITDKNGTTTATVSDGTNGTNGTNGRDGYVQYTAGDNITITDNTISATVPTIDLSNYYTKAEIDARIPTYWLDLKSYWYLTGSTTITNADDKANAIAIINDAYAKGYKYANIMLTGTTSNAQVLLSYGKTNQNLQSKPTIIDFFGIYADGRMGPEQLRPIYSIQLRIGVTWSGNTASIDLLRIWHESTTYISTQNTSSFTPTDNYHPATKKYVDDSITSAITTTLGGSF